MKKRLFTIGHSNHEFSWFLELLNEHRINCVVDVRSVAASRFNPQYNKKALFESLKGNGIEYVHMPEEFGARRTDRGVLTNNRVDFKKVRATSQFLSGVERLNEGLKKGFKIALMCAEADPLECHRFSMISYDLKDKGFEILHILKDKSVITNQDLELQLVNKYKKKLLTSNLFQSAMTFEERLDTAYTLHNGDIGYVAESGIPDK